MSDRNEKILIENINTPGRTNLVSAAMYNAMKDAMLKALPEQAPGLTQAEMREAVLSYLPQDLFPGGNKVGWWAKAVQLDLEAKRAVVREASKPLRWHRVPAEI